MEKAFRNSGDTYQVSTSRDTETWRKDTVRTQLGHIQSSETLDNTGVGHLDTCGHRLTFPKAFPVAAGS